MRFPLRIDRVQHREFFKPAGRHQHVRRQVMPLDRRPFVLRLVNPDRDRRQDAEKEANIRD